MIGIVDDNSLFYAAQTLKQLAKYARVRRSCLSARSRTIRTYYSGVPWKDSTDSLGATPTVRANPLLRKDQAEHLYLWSER